MQVTATTGWYGRRKGGLGTDFKPTDFEDLHNTSREKIVKKTQAMTNTNMEEEARSTVLNSIFNSTAYPFTKQQDEALRSIESPNKPFNSHFYHRTEEYHRPESRAFLKDPMWPRTDFAPDLGAYAGRNSPKVSQQNFKLQSNCCVFRKLSSKWKILP